MIIRHSHHLHPHPWSSFSGARDRTRERRGVGTRAAGVWTDAAEPVCFWRQPCREPCFFFSDLPSTFAAAISAAGLPMPSACMVCFFSAMRALRSCSYGAAPLPDSGESNDAAAAAVAATTAPTAFFLASDTPRPESPVTETTAVRFILGAYAASAADCAAKGTSSSPRSTPSCVSCACASAEAAAVKSREFSSVVAFV